MTTPAPPEPDVAAWLASASLTGAHVSIADFILVLGDRDAEAAHKRPA